MDVKTLNGELAYQFKSISKASKVLSEKYNRCYHRDKIKESCETHCLYKNFIFEYCNSNI